MKLFCIGSRGSGDVVLRYFFSRTLVAILFGRAEPFGKFCKRIYEEHFYEIILNLGQWFRRS